MNCSVCGVGVANGVVVGGSTPFCDDCFIKERDNPGWENRERKAKQIAELQASQICKNCLWWKVRGDQFSPDEVQKAGHCQVNPPTSTGLPQTLESDRCSRFVRRAEPDMASDAQTLKSWEATAKEESGARERLNAYAAKRGLPVGALTLDFIADEIERLEQIAALISQSFMTCVANIDHAGDHGVIIRFRNDLPKTQKLHRLFFNILQSPDEMSASH